MFKFAALVLNLYLNQSASNSTFFKSSGTWGSICLSFCWLSGTFKGPVIGNWWKFSRRWLSNESVDIAGPQKQTSASLNFVQIQEKGNVINEELPTAQMGRKGCALFVEPSETAPTISKRIMPLKPPHQVVLRSIGSFAPQFPVDNNFDIAGVKYSQ